MPKKTARPSPKPKRQATFIRDWRKHRALKVWQLAERVGISESQLSRIETGKSPYIQDLLEAIAIELGCSASDLLIRRPTDPASIWDMLAPLQAEDRARVEGFIEALKKSA